MRGFLLTMQNAGSILRFAPALLPKSDTAVLDIEILLAHVLQKSREDIICFPELIIEHDKLLFLEELIQQRVQGKSIAQIVGEKYFWKSKFIVSSDVLVPRPDSEILIEAVLNLYKSKFISLKIADFGTGSGCLIISLLHEYENSQGLAFEKNKFSYNIAHKNARFFGVLSRLQLVFGNWELCYDKLDLIVSNPPYIKKRDIGKLPKTIAKYEPFVALNGGNNGLSCYYSIIKKSVTVLRSGGYLVLEVSDKKQFLQVRKIAQSTSLQFCKFYTDLLGEVRCVIFEKKM